MKDYNTLYQHGTLALLVPGLLAGTTTIAELLKHGDTGIGTGEGLDGELIILDGKPYQANSKGQVKVISDDFVLPFGDVNWAKYDHLTDFKNIDDTDFSHRVFVLANSQNTFFSVKAEGVFTNISIRAVAKSNRPYKTLAATAEDQSVFKRNEVKGTLLGYYAPELFAGAAVAGFHYHFISKDKKFGGHVLSFHADNVKVYVQQFSTLQQRLPVDNQEYMKHDFSKDNIIDDINKSE